MSKQRDILPQVLDFVRQHIPDCPVYLSGSVALAHERADSDIDLVIIVPSVAEVDLPGSSIECHEANFKLATVVFEDVPLHLHIATVALLQEFERKPWRAYKFLQTEMLHDPEGIVQASKDRIAPWFDGHPDAVDLWKQWLREHNDRQVSRGEKLDPLVKKFPEQVTDLWPYLDEEFGQEIAEQPLPGGSLKTAPEA